MISAFKRLLRELNNWEKISANHISDKGLVSRTYKEMLKLNNNQTTHLKMHCLQKTDSKYKNRKGFFSY